MAKRTRAPARRSRVKRRPRPHRKPTSIRGPVGVPISYTPELLADGRYRYEQTDESLISIASDFGVNRNTFRALAVREGWVRFKPPPRDLSPAAKLLAQADDLRNVGLGAQNDVPSAPAATPVEGKAELQPSNSADVASGAPALPPLGETIARLHRAILEELAAVEAMRARLKREPQSPIDAERTARTLSSLTETLQKLQRLQCALPENELNNDDMSIDIDEFRNELARRINAFVDSRTGGGDAEGAAARPLDPVR